MVEQIQAIAEKKGISSTQMCLAWLLKEGARRGQRVIPIPGSTRTAGVQECIDAASIELTDDEYKQLRQVIESADIVGGRYHPAAEATLEG